MNFCDGGDLCTKLKSLVKECQTLKENQVVEWFVQIAMALQVFFRLEILSEFYLSVILRLILSMQFPALGL